MMMLRFTTYEPRAYGYPSTIEVARVQRPGSVAELEEVIRAQYKKHVEHGYKLIVRVSAEWQIQFDEAKLDDVLLRTAPIVYVVCRRPRQRRDGFKFLID
jgi:hypothetical protein